MGDAGKKALGAISNCSIAQVYLSLLLREAKGLLHLGLLDVVDHLRIVTGKGYPLTLGSSHLLDLAGES